MLEPTLTYAILGVWSWSLLQFCFVLGAAAGGDGGEQGSRRRKKSAREGERAEQPNAECRQNCDEVVKFFGRVLFSIIVKPRPFTLGFQKCAFYRAPGKSLYVVARSFCLVMPGSCLAKQTYFFGGHCTEVQIKVYMSC